MSKNEQTRELTDQEIEVVSGGMYSHMGYYAAINQFVHPLDIVSVKAIDVVAIGR
jgi:hypothetical protein